MAAPIRVSSMALLFLAGFLCAPEAAASDRMNAGGNARAESDPVRAARAALDAGDHRQTLAILNARTTILSAAERDSIEGRARFLAGDFAVARRKLESALQRRPRQAEDLYWLGRAYAAGGSPRLAAERFQQAHWIGFESAGLHHHWAVVLRSFGQLLGKISQRPRPQEAGEPIEPGSFAFGGIVLGPVPGRPDRLIVSPPESAIYQVSKALELEPGRPDSLLLCAEVWAAVNLHEQAVACFAKAAPRLSGSEPARCHDGWANSALALGRFDDYLEHARESMRLAGGIDSAKLARCYDRVADEVAQRGSLKRQIRHLTMAAELEPRPARLIKLADALMLAQRTQDAVRTLEQALEHSPTKKQRLAIKRRLLRSAPVAAVP